MSDRPWAISLESEAARLFPWLDTDPDPAVARIVLAFIGELLRWPWRPEAEDGDTGIYGATIGRTGIDIIWTIDERSRTLILIHLGERLSP